METSRSFGLKIKQLSDEGKFTGYAATYNNVDLTGDILAPGCFNSAIKGQGAGFPILWSHRTDEPIGLGRISDSQSGLVLEGSLLLSDSQAARVWGFIKSGIVKGLSIGFSVNQNDVTYAADGVRTIRQLYLHEISLVSIAANPKAEVISVRSLDQVENVLRGVKAADVDSDMLQQLRSIETTLRGLLRKDSSCQCTCPSCPDDCLNCVDQCDACEGGDCAGCQLLAEQDAEDLKLLKEFAMELKGITG